MAKLSDEKAEKLRTLTVEFVLEVRAAYLKNGGGPLKHWEQIQARMIGAARRSATADEWATAVVRRLQLPALGSNGSRALHDLCAAVRESGATGEWLTMIEREYGLLLAMARRISEERRDAREAMDPTTGEMKEVHDGA